MRIRHLLPPSFQVKKMKATNPARDAKFSQEANMVVSGKLSIGKLPQPQMLHIEFSKDGSGFSHFIEFSKDFSHFIEFLKVVS